MRKIFYLFVCFVLIISMCGCPDKVFEDEHFLIINNSNKTIAYYLADNSSTIYPDTILPENNLTALIENGKKYYSPVFKVNVDYLYFFVLDPDTIRKYPWEEIRSEYKILKRYKLDVKKIREGGYVVTYP